MSVGKPIKKSDQKPQQTTSPVQVQGAYEEEFGKAYQEHLLAVCVRDPTFILRFRSALDPEYFSNPVHRAIARGVFTLVDQYELLPTRAVAADTIYPLLKGPNDKVLADKIMERIYEEEDISDLEIVGDRVVEFGKQQAMCRAVIAGAEALQRGERHKIIPLVEEAELVGTDLLDVGVNYVEVDRSAWYCEGGKVRDVIPTGIGNLDKCLDGGLGRRELGVILAPPKRGKTTTLVNFGFGAVTAIPVDLERYGYNVVHYSAEIEQDKVARRYDDRLALKLVDQKLKDPEGYVIALNERLETQIRGRLIIKSYPTRTLTVGMIRSHMSILRAQGIVPDLVIVDYADILKPQRRLGETRHEIAGIYEDLRTLAGQWNVAVWTASQAKVSALEKDTLDIGDFAEAFEKAAIVDTAIAFCQGDIEYATDLARLAIIATRDQEDHKVVRCHIHRRQCYLKSDVGGAGEGITNLGLSPGMVEGGGGAPAGQATTSAAEKVQKAAGVKPPGEGKKPVKKTASKTVARRPRKPTKKVDPA